MGQYVKSDKLHYHARTWSGPPLHIPKLGKTFKLVMRSRPVHGRG